MVALCSRKTGIPERSIWADLEKLVQRSKQGERIESSVTEAVPLSPEELIAGIIYLGRQDQRKSFTENSFDSDEIKERAKVLMGEEALLDIMENGRYDKDTLIFETEAKLAGADLKKTADDLLLRIEKKILERKLYETARMLDSEKDVKARRDLSDQTKKISKRIAELNNQKNK
jgi:hypothetical protein